MKLTFHPIPMIFVVLTGLALLSHTAAAEETAVPPFLQSELVKVRVAAERAAAAVSSHDKANAWLAVNRQAVRFASEMNRAFPHSRIQGDVVEPQGAQNLAQKASAFGVRVFFCEPDASWAASNEGYFKYLELWPTGPNADEAWWMGPAGNQAGCGDFEGSPEELQDMILKNQSFVTRFPHSRFAAEAAKRLAYAQKALASQGKPPEQK